MKNNLVRTICIKLFTLLFVAGIFNHSYSQIDGLKNVGTISLNGFGNVVKGQELIGYYFLYNMEPDRAMNNSFVFKVLDLNFKEITSSKIALPTVVYLTEVLYSGESYALKFWDNVKGQEAIVFVSDKGVQLSENRRQCNLTEASIRYSTVMATIENMPFSTLHSMKSMGFIENYEARKGSRISYEISRFDNSGKKKWSYATDKDSKMAEGSSFLGAGSSEVYSLVFKRKNLFARYANRFVLCNDMNTGAKVFEVPLVNSKYQISPQHGFYNEAQNDYTIFGTYYTLEEEDVNTKSLGFYTGRIGRDGIVKDETFQPWSEVGKLALGADKAKFQDMGSVYFHSVFQSSGGKIYALAEGYRKFSGKTDFPKKEEGSGVVGATIIENLMLFTFSKDGKMEAAKVFEKQHSSIRLNFTPEYVGLHIWGDALKAVGLFDFTFIALNKDRSNATIGYQVFNPENYTSKVNFNYIIIDKDNLSKGTTPFDRRKTGFFKVIPSLKGQAAIFEYLKKEKFLDMRTVILK